MPSVRAEPSRFSVWWSLEDRVDQWASLGALACGLFAVALVFVL